MVSLSIRGITGWVNPFFLAVRRPWTISIVWGGLGAPFFVAPLGALSSGGSVVGGGSRWSAAVRDTPGRPTRQTPARTPWLQA
jgi:hypothetical protein